MVIRAFAEDFLDLLAHDDLSGRGWLAPAELSARPRWCLPGASSRAGPWRRLPIGRSPRASERRRLPLPAHTWRVRET